LSTELLDQLYKKLAENLNISESKMDNITSSYKAVGTYLGNLEKNLDIVIYPQGSLALGTAINPLSTDRNGSYDVDLVCELRAGYHLRAKDVKNIIGDRLKESSRYRRKIETEGKRCWTLTYADFHMDILPCIPKNKVGDSSTIKITEKVNEQYSYSLSDPKAYRKWFIQEMGHVFIESRNEYASKASVEIEDVELFKLHTPLQMSIQILKRHRDIMFRNRENKPISIIITTLAALSYNGEWSIFSAIKNILSNMVNYIQKNEYGEYEILNPTNVEENFADRWNKQPVRAELFFEWLKRAQKDIITEPFEFAGGLNGLKQQFANSFGGEMAEQTFIVYGKMMGEKSERKELGITNDGHITTQRSRTKTRIQEHTFYGGSVKLNNNFLRKES